MVKNVVWFLDNVVSSIFNFAVLLAEAPFQIDEIDRLIDRLRALRLL